MQLLSASLKFKYTTHFERILTSQCYEAQIIHLCVLYYMPSYIPKSTIYNIWLSISIRNTRVKLLTPKTHYVKTLNIMKYFITLLPRGDLEPTDDAMTLKMDETYRCIRNEHGSKHCGKVTIERKMYKILCRVEPTAILRMYYYV